MWRSAAAGEIGSCDVERSLGDTTMTARTGDDSSRRPIEDAGVRADEATDPDGF